MKEYINFLMDGFYENDENYLNIMINFLKLKIVIIV